MLERLPRKGEYVFGGGELDNFARWFYIKRRKMADKLGNPRIRRIGFKTFRHLKATMLYHRTRDILLAQSTLGHRDLRNTLVYTHLIDNENDDFVCKVARSVDEAKELVESGFDYVTDMDNMKLFRKRK
jgi:integrase